MAYNAFDQNKPTVSDTRALVVLETNENVKALRDMIMIGGDGSIEWAGAITAGTNDKPTEIVLSNGTQRQRWILVWSSENVTSITGAYSSNSGTLYDTIAAFTFTRDGDDVIGGNVGSFMLFMLMKTISEARTGAGAAAHIAQTGTAVHGLGSMSVQNAGAVAISGGTIDGVHVGGSVPADGSFINVMEVHAVVAFGGASTNLDLATGTSFGVTATGSGAAALTFSNPPPTNKLSTILLVLTNGGLRTWTWPTGTKWPSATAPTPTTSGTDLYSFSTVDGGTTWHGTTVSKGSA